MPKLVSSALLVFLVCLAAAGWISAGGALAAQKKGQGAGAQRTEERVRGKGWWPTRRDAARKEYAGTEACAGCHQAIVQRYRETPMAQAAWTGETTAVLRSTAKIAHALAPYETEITREGKGSRYTVQRGNEAMGGPILWSMGAGVMGQTFVLQTGGSLYESQLSYFSAIHALDLTPGHAVSEPRDRSQGLEHAFGERLSDESAQRCFGCHTTASTVRRNFDASRAVPGVGCEACHGPGAVHVKAMQEKRFDAGRAAILNPGGLDPVEVVDFCGACHRAPQDVVASKDFLPINIRFQPYRLAKSRCWSRPDDRISCTGCHDPHGGLVREAVFYDAKCESCHGLKGKAVAAKDPGGAVGAVASRGGGLPACPVGVKDCVSCHMPRYQVPQMHGSFTDHDIRIVRAGKSFPL